MIVRGIPAAIDTTDRPGAGNSSARRVSPRVETGQRETGSLRMAAEHEGDL